MLRWQTRRTARSRRPQGEIYYNLNFGWSEGPSRPNGVDMERVATREAGHAFGLGHFGKVFVDNTGRLEYAPRAIMNAVYISPSPR